MEDHIANHNNLEGITRTQKVTSPFSIKSRYLCRDKLEKSHNEEHLGRSRVAEGPCASMGFQSREGIGMARQYMQKNQQAKKEKDRRALAITVRLVSRWSGLNNTNVFLIPPSYRGAFGMRVIFPDW